IANRSRRNHADPCLVEVLLERDLIEELEGADFDFLHLLDAEIEQYGLLHPSVGDPATLCSLRGDAELTAIEKGKGFANGGLSFRLAQTASVFERLAHQGLELLLIHSQGVVR